MRTRPTIVLAFLLASCATTPRTCEEQIEDQYRACMAPPFTNPGEPPQLVTSEQAESCMSTRRAARAECPATAPAPSSPDAG